MNESDPLREEEGPGPSTKDLGTTTDDDSDDSTQHQELDAATKNITDPTKPGRKTEKLKVSGA